MNLPRKNYPTTKILKNQIDEKWSIDLMNMSDFRILNKNEFMYMFVSIDKISKNS